MMTNAEMLTAAVKADPLNPAPRAALADELASETGDASLTAVGAGIIAFVAHLDEVQARHYEDSGFKFAPPPVHRADYISEKWVRIVRIDRTFEGGSRDGPVVAFVAIKQNTTKALGTVFLGDIHKPASWKAPAKHARGNILLPNFGSPVGASGHVNYLR